jgi:hypothetical protein
VTFIRRLAYLARNHRRGKPAQRMTHGLLRRGTFCGPAGASARWAAAHTGALEAAGQVAHPPAARVPTTPGSQDGLLPCSFNASPYVLRIRRPGYCPPRLRTRDPLSRGRHRGHLRRGGEGRISASLGCQSGCRDRPGCKQEGPFLDRKGPLTWEPPIGIEPMTYALRVRRSNRLS